MHVHVTTRVFRPEDYASVTALWSATEGVEISEGDDPLTIERYLERNPGLSRVAEQDGRVVGAVLCGHDGRRGFLYHLAVAPEVRRQGIGEKLVEDCIEGLRTAGVHRVLILVETENHAGRAFWGRQKFSELTGATAFGLTLF